MKTASFGQNTTGRDFVVGDLHGCFDALQIDLKRAMFNSDTDRLFSVGDLIDRGEQSLECLLLLNKPWFHAVLGNHEQMMLDYLLRGGDYGHWLNNGGQWYDQVKSDHRLKEVLPLAEQLPHALSVQTEIGSIGITHAEPPDDWADLWKEHDAPRFLDLAFADKLIWGRSKVRALPMDTKDVTGIDYTVHGHTPLKQPVARGNSLFIDTGAVFGNKLTMLELKDIPEFVHMYTFPKIVK